jgi:cyanate permease
VTPAAGFALGLLIFSWAAIAQLPWSLWLLSAGIVFLDFAVQVVHVGNQHMLTTAYSDRLSSAIGSYMVFYSLGSALGAAATTAVFTACGWVCSSLVGAGFATCALIVWAIDRRQPPDGSSLPASIGGLGEWLESECWSGGNGSGACACATWAKRSRSPRCAEPHATIGKRARCVVKNVYRVA